MAWKWIHFGGIKNRMLKSIVILMGFPYNSASTLRKNDHISPTVSRHFWRDDDFPALPFGGIWTNRSQEDIREMRFQASSNSIPVILINDSWFPIFADSLQFCLKNRHGSWRSWRKINEIHTVSSNMAQSSMIRAWYERNCGDETGRLPVGLYWSTSSSGQSAIVSSFSSGDLSKWT